MAHLMCHPLVYGFSICVDECHLFVPWICSVLCIFAMSLTYFNYKRIIYIHGLCFFKNLFIDLNRKYIYSNIPNIWKEYFKIFLWKNVWWKVFLAQFTSPLVLWFRGNLSFQFLMYPSVEFSSGQSLSCVWLCDSMDCSTPGLPVHHQLLEFTQTHIHWVSDAIQPSHLVPFSRLQSFPTSESFHMSQLFASGGQSIGVSASA